MKFSFFIFSVLLLSGVVSAQRPQLSVWSIEDGLSESTVNDLVQDSKGFLWIATGFGLNKFDGFEFSTLYVKDGLKSNRVLSLLPAKGNVIWVGTDSGLNYIQDEKIMEVPTLEALNNKPVISLFEDNVGELWIGTDGFGVWNLNTNDELIQYSQSNGLSNDQVRDIAQHPDGSLWFATRNGVTVLSEGNFIQYNVENGLPEYRIRDIEISKDGSVWIGTREGIAIFQNNTFRYINKTNGLVNDRVQAMAFDGNGGVWIGTEEGISHFNGANFKNYNVQNGLPINIVNQIFIDRENNVWFGTFGGGFFNFRGFLFENYIMEDGLPNNLVTNFMETPDGSFWISTFGGGMLQISKNEKIIHNAGKGFSDNKVYRLFKDKNNGLWAGTQSGVSKFRSGGFENLPETKFPFRKVRDGFYETPSGVWYATYDDGVIYFDGNVYTNFTEADGLASNTVLKIVEGDNSELWFATYGGVSKFSKGTFTSITVQNGLVNNGVLDGTRSSDGAIWFGTFGGVSRIKNGEIINITQNEGLPNQVVYFVKETSDGYLWFGTNNGVVRFDFEVYKAASGFLEKLDAFKLYNTENGLIADEMNTGAVYEDIDGNLWFGSIDGAIKMNRHFEKPDTVKPLIHITKVNAAGKDYLISDNLVFENDNNFLQFEFLGIDYRAPKQLLYEYRIKGIDPDWQITSERIAKYPSVPVGRYNFEVRARDSDGNWSTERALVSFIVLPPFWLRWWFVLIVGLLFTGVLFFIYKFYNINRAVDIERVRVRIASDLHDDVGSNLTEIALQSDFLQALEVDDTLKETLKNIGKQCRQIVTSLDDIVWSIDARNDTAGDLTDRMQDYLNHVLESKDIVVHYDFDELRAKEKLSVLVRENLYLIFKEAVNNISKYSNGTDVHISFKTSTNDFCMIISDNGTTAGIRKKTGHGLRNMEMRANRIGASFRISSNPGFTIKVEGKLN